MTTALTALGSLLILIGLWTGYQALFMQIDMGGTVNLSLIQAQTMTFAFAATAFLGGVILLVGGCLYYALNQRND